jgi:hypothetical protein
VQDHCTYKPEERGGPFPLHFALVSCLVITRQFFEGCLRVLIADVARDVEWLWGCVRLVLERNTNVSRRMFDSQRAMDGVRDRSVSGFAVFRPGMQVRRAGR